jgi:hypothetical protein
MKYRAGWDFWKKQKANEGNRIIEFFENIHKLDTTKDVEDYVNREAPREAYEYHIQKQRKL